MEENADAVPEPEPGARGASASGDPRGACSSACGACPRACAGACGGCCARDGPQAKRPPARKQEQGQTPEKCAGTGATASRAPRASEG